MEALSFILIFKDLIYNRAIVLTIKKILAIDKSLELFHILRPLFFKEQILQLAERVEVYALLSFLLLLDVGYDLHHH